MVTDYCWLESTLSDIAANQHIQVEDVPSKARGSPVFVVAGACPNPLCGMQAVVYCVMSEPTYRMDFWWLKPSASNPRKIEPGTLNRNIKGANKNDAGRSKALYSQFADLFQLGASAADRQTVSSFQNKVGGGKLAFNIIEVNGAPRACIEQLGSGEKYFLYLIWQV